MNSRQLCCLTQIIFVEFNLFHHRGHDKRERLPVEEVQRVADEHGEKNGSTVVAIACGPHDDSLQNQI